MEKSFASIVVPIVGPTASGKSLAALELAQKLGGEIINCDSVQFYRYVQIGAAKPTQKDREKIPHHLLDVVEPNETFTAADFRAAALKILKERSQLGIKIFYVVGGSGFYLQALLKGMYEIPPASDEIKRKVREDLAKNGTSFLYEQLKSADPNFASQISPQDTYRIQRGIEILRSTGKTPSQAKSGFKSEPFPYPVTSFGFNPGRDELVKRIETRTAQMLHDGLIEETQDLINRGFAATAPLRSVGYKETVAFINGEVAHEDLANEITISTRQLAKRQVTWFKRDPSIMWEQPNTAGIENVEKEIKKALEKI